MSEQAPQFSVQEAQTLISHAESAPLQNIQHSAHISGILFKFKTWYEHVTAEIASFDERIAIAVKEAEDKIRAEFSEKPSPAEETAS